MQAEQGFLQLRRGTLQYHPIILKIQAVEAQVLPARFLASIMGKMISLWGQLQTKDTCKVLLVIVGHGTISSLSTMK